MFKATQSSVYLPHLWLYSLSCKAQIKVVGCSAPFAGIAVYIAVSKEEKCEAKKKKIVIELFEPQAAVGL